MPKNISKELEQKILSLSQKEKDRHLLRLIAANKLLREQLQFTLLEKEADLKWRVADLETENEQVMTEKYHQPVSLTAAIRKRSAAITWHRRVTKDKYGEVKLWANLLILVLEHQHLHLSSGSRKADVLRVYVVKKVQNLMKLVQALHEDYQIDFFADINRILQLLYTFETKFEAARHQLPREIEE